MLEKETTVFPGPPIRLRALVVDPNDARRDEVVDLLTHQGIRVFSCASVDHGRQIFDDHAMVVAPLNGDNRAVLDFVHWLRTKSGPTQPYVLGVGEYEAPASEWHGFNEFVAPPIDTTKVHMCVEAARRWHGWAAEISQIAPTVPEVAFVHNIPEPEPAEISVPEKTTPTAAEAKFDWAAIVADVTCEEPAKKQGPTNPPAEPESLQEAKPAREPAPTPPATPLALPPEMEPSLATESFQEMTANLHQEITESSPFGLLLLDDAANVIYANPQHRAVLGLTIDEAGGLTKWLEKGCAADPQSRKSILDTWWEHVWRRRISLVLTMKSAEGLLKEIEFRPSPISNERLLVAIFDVTDARRDEESMRASEARFRNLFLQTPAAVVVVNAAGNITDASSAFEKLVGCSRLDMRRLGLDQFFSEDDLILVRKHTFSARQGRDLEPINVEIRPRQSSPKMQSLTISVVKNSSGAPVFTAYYFQNFVPPTAVAAPLQQPAASPKLERLLEAVPDLVLELSADGVIHSVFPSRDFDSLPVDREAAIGKPFGQIFPPLAAKLPLTEMITNLEESLDAEVRCEFKVVLPDEETPRVCEARMVALRPASADETSYGKTRFGLVIRDLSKAVQAHPAPAPAHTPPKSTNFSFSAIHLLRQAVLVTNEKGRICDLNPAAESLFGYTREELIDSGLYKLFLPDQPKEFAQKISEHLNRHRCWIGKSTFHHKDGTTGRVSIEFVPYEENERKGFIGFIRDVTAEEKQPEEKTETPQAPEPVAASVSSPSITDKETPPQPVVTLHRARNDFQVLSSLLSMQASEEGMPDSVRQALREGKDRVAAVALVYRLLDGQTGLVNFTKYTAEVAAQVLRSHAIEDDRITIIPAGPSAMVHQKLAIPLGLILQELLHSILKHAFPHQARGTVEVSLSMQPTEGLLSIKDNGPFQPESIVADRTKGFGWQIVEALTQQIRGELKILSDLENEMRLRFRLDGSELIAD